MVFSRKNPYPRKNEGAYVETVSAALALSSMFNMENEVNIPYQFENENFNNNEVQERALFMDIGLVNLTGTNNGKTLSLAVNDSFTLDCVIFQALFNNLQRVRIDSSVNNFTMAIFDKNDNKITNITNNQDLTSLNITDDEFKVKVIANASTIITNIHFEIYTKKLDNSSKVNLSAEQILGKFGNDKLSELDKLVTGTNNKGSSVINNIDEITRTGFYIVKPHSMNPVPNNYFFCNAVYDGSTLVLTGTDGEANFYQRQKAGSVWGSYVQFSRTDHTHTALLKIQEHSHSFAPPCSGVQYTIDHLITYGGSSVELVGLSGAVTNPSTTFQRITVRKASPYLASYRTSNPNKVDWICPLEAVKVIHAYSTFNNVSASNSNNFIFSLYQSGIFINHFLYEVELNFYNMSIQQLYDNFVSKAIGVTFQMYVKG